VLSEERRRAILDLIERDGRLVRKLASKFGRSEVTTRQDLDMLHSHGLVHRERGGALPVRTAALLDPSLQGKAKLHRKEKQRIALAQRDW